MRASRAGLVALAALGLPPISTPLTATAPGPWHLLLRLRRPPRARVRTAT